MAKHSIQSDPVHSERCAGQLLDAARSALDSLAFEMESGIILDRPSELAPVIR
jgi:hypothetical protein